MNRNFSKNIFVSLLLMLLLAPVNIYAGDSGAVPTPDKNGRYLFSVTLHTAKEIESLLSRAESLSHSLTLHKKEHAGIALVLHGSEIKFFDKRNYRKFQNIVDKAARLDANDVLEIKICKTLMDEMNIREEDMPSFVEIVPYGPDEEDRLITQGYTYL